MDKLNLTREQVEINTGSMGWGGLTAKWMKEDWLAMYDENARLQKRVEELENAWMIDETIQADGSLRPSISATIARYEKELSDLRTSLDEAVKEVSKTPQPTERPEK